MSGGVVSRNESGTWLAIGVLSLAIVTAVAVLLLRSPSGGHDAEQSMLPSINAMLNGTAAALLALGYFFIRRRQIRAHRICMTTAVLASTLFLLGYVTHHYQVGSVRFAGPGWLKAIYLAILIPHVVLSAVMVPMALTTLAHALRGQFVRHKRIARWTLPIWLYVSVSGVVVYWMLYHLGR